MIGGRHSGLARAEFPHSFTTNKRTTFRLGHTCELLISVEPVLSESKQYPV
jgi:hypothetical protein